MPADTSMLHIRIDNTLKAKAAEALDAIGLSTADAVRILFRRIVAEQAFPWELKVPNAVTRGAIAESDEIMRSGKFRFATAEEMFAELDKPIYE